MIIYLSTFSSGANQALLEVAYKLFHVPLYSMVRALNIQDSGIYCQVGETAFR